MVLNRQIYCYNNMSRTVRKIQLPKDYADRLLDCEIAHKLSDKPSKQMIKSLIELYTLGVQYYESIRSHKYLYFQLKMNEIFTAASTTSALNESVPVTQVESPLKKKMRSSLEEDKIQAIRIKHQQQKMMQEMASNVSQAATASTIKKIMSDNQQKHKSINQKVSKQIAHQDQSLMRKIQKRKSRLLYSKSFSSVGENDTKQSLFSDSAQKTTIQMKPIQVNFDVVIKQNENDDEQDHTDSSLNHKTTQQVKQ